MFAEARERIGNSPSDEQARRTDVDESDRVPKHIGPKAGAGRDDDRVIRSRLDVCDPVARWSLAVEFRKRNKFEKQSVAGDQPHAVMRTPVRNRDEAFARG